VGFRAVYVFDVDQTDGAELPEFSSTVKGEVGDKLDKLIQFTDSQQVKLEFSEKIAPARGMSYGGLIRLLPDMEPAESLAVLVHELAHEMLHRAERRTLTTKAVRETEAEAVAFVVCQAIGLETGTASADYIQLWHGDADLLRESLEAVQQTAAVILGALPHKRFYEKVIKVKADVAALLIFDLRHISTKKFALGSLRSDDWQLG